MHRLFQKAPPQVQPISTGDIPSNHQPISQRLRSQSTYKKLKPNTATDKPVDHLTQSRTTQQALRVQKVLAAQWKYPAKLIDILCNPRSVEHIAMPVLENKTGEPLEYR